MLITVFGFFSTIGCFATGELVLPSPLPPGVLARTDEYEFAIGSQTQTHSERMYCLVQDANDLTDCDESGDDCMRGCRYTIQSFEESSNAQRSIEAIDEDFWVEIGTSQWAHIERTAPQATLSAAQ